MWHHSPALVNFPQTLGNKLYGSLSLSNFTTSQLPAASNHFSVCLSRWQPPIAMDQGKFHISVRDVCQWCVSIKKNGWLRHQTHFAELEYFDAHFFDAPRKWVVLLVSIDDTTSSPLSLNLPLSKALVYSQYSQGCCLRCRVSAAWLRFRSRTLLVCTCLKSLGLLPFRASLAQNSCSLQLHRRVWPWRNQSGVIDFQSQVPIQEHAHRRMQQDSEHL
jgi:hypothetical protein